jgi:hypothetical protein
VRKDGKEKKHMTKQQILTGLAASALLAFSAACASAATVSVNFAGDAGKTVGAGTLTGTLVSGNEYEATSGTFEIYQSPTLTTGIYNLVANPNYPGATILGTFIYDDKVMDGVQPFLNSYGLLFGSGALQLNLWYDGGTPDGYVLANDGSRQVRGAAFESLVGAPDGGSAVALLGGALLGLQMLRRKLFV